MIGYLQFHKLPLITTKLNVNQHHNAIWPYSKTINVINLIESPGILQLLMMFVTLERKYIGLTDELFKYID